MNRPIEWVYQVIGKLYLENLVLQESLNKKEDIKESQDKQKEKS